MFDYNYYLDKAKEVQGFKYDNEIDNALGFKASMACRLRKGTAHLGQEQMVELAKLANEDEVLALMSYITIRASGSAKSTWEKALDRIQSAALSVAVLFVTAFPQTSNAATFTENILKTINSEIYIM